MAARFVVFLLLTLHEVGNGEVMEEGNVVDKVEVVDEVKKEVVVTERVSRELDLRERVRGDILSNEVVGRSEGCTPGCSVCHTVHRRECSTRRTPRLLPSTITTCSSPPGCTGGTRRVCKIKCVLLHTSTFLTNPAL